LQHNTNERARLEVLVKSEGYGTRVEVLPENYRGKTAAGSRALPESRWTSGSCAVHAVCDPITSGKSFPGDLSFLRTARGYTADRLVVIRVVELGAGPLAKQG